MAREVVHDDHIAGAKRRDQDMADIGLEPVTVDRPVERHRRDHAGLSQSGDQRRGLSMGSDGLDIPHLALC